MKAQHQKAIAFIQCARAQDTCGKHDENNEIALYLIGLVTADQKGQPIAAQSVTKGEEVKIAPSVAAGNAGYRETAL